MVGDAKRGGDRSGSACCCRLLAAMLDGSLHACVQSNLPCTLHTKRASCKRLHPTHRCTHHMHACNPHANKPHAKGAVITAPTFSPIARASWIMLMRPISAPCSISTGWPVGGPNTSYVFDASQLTPLKKQPLQWRTGGFACDACVGGVGMW